MAFIDPFMNRQETGTDDDDFIVGSLGNDSIDGLEGDDVLNGLTGRDVIDGGEGNDALDGGVGDDVVVGGFGNDKFMLNAGDDDANGGDGNDHYAVNGTAGDVVTITDTDGTEDTLDVRGAITSAIINMSGGEDSFVDGRIIRLTGGETVTLPLDVMLLQDTSGSFGDDIARVQGLIPELVDGVRAIAADSDFGLAIFTDKPVGPFGIETDDEFKLIQALSPDADTLEASYGTVVLQNGNDLPESQLTALHQVAKRAAEIGWGTGLRVAVVFTDASFHQAGDFAGAPANNDDGVLDGTPPGSGEDYVSIIQTRDALRAEGIIPIFAVTDGNEAVYNDLVTALGGGGAVVNLAEDSRNLVKVITEGIRLVTNTVIENAIGGDYDDEINGNEADNNIRGNGGDDEIDGEDGADELFGNAGNDEIDGGKGNDTIEGGDGDDLANGGSGADAMTGGAGNDDLRGAGGGDTMTGGDGNDTLRGGAGADVIDGGNGDDLLDGQGGVDTFIFTGAWGNDTIDGYSPSATGGADDVLDIDGIADLAAFLALATQVDDDVVFSNGTSTITILDVELVDFTNADFI